MEHSRPDGSAPVERQAIDPSEKHSLSGEKWRTLFGNIYQRADAAPEKPERIEKDLEMRHEHKDVSATTGLQLGAVIAEAATDADNDESPFDHIPLPKTQPTDQPATDHPSPAAKPDYPAVRQSPPIMTWVIVAVLVIAIVIVLSILL